MKHKRLLQTGGAVALLAAGAFMTNAAEAACPAPPPGGLACGGSSTTWFQTINNACGFRGTTIGYALNDGTKGLGVNLENTGCLEAVGLTSGGAVISGCHSIDTTNDGSSVVDITGCNSAVKYSYSGVIPPN